MYVCYKNLNKQKEWHPATKPLIIIRGGPPYLSSSVTAQTLGFWVGDWRAPDRSVSYTDSPNPDQNSRQGFSTRKLKKFTIFKHKQMLDILLLDLKEGLANSSRSFKPF
jgi:hypothetical protein